MSRRSAFAVAASALILTSIGVTTPAALADPVRPEVVNGRDPSPGEIRPLVYVSAGGYSCGGTLVDTLHVVTAGHCSVNNTNATFRPSQVTVSWGPSTYFYDLDRYPVTQVTTHPDYDPQTLDNDIAVLTLAAPIPGATPMPIASVAESEADLAAGKSVRSAGYGNLSFDGQASDYLKVADLTVMSDSVCGSDGSERIGGITFYGIGANTDHFVCAIGVESGTRNIVDTCQGDSGGPLFGGTTTPYLLGVVSSGYGCAGVDEDGPMPQKTPGIYTRVSAYLPWLAEQGVDTGSTTSTAPRIVSAVPGVGSLTVVVAPGSGGSVENYQIYVENTADPSDTWYCDVPPTEDTCGFSDLTPGAQYAVTVRYEGSEEVSDPVYVTVDDVPSTAPPVKPKITKGWNMGGGRVKLKVRVGQQPEGTLVWVQCTSEALTKTATVKKGRANLRLDTGWRYSCKAIAENEAGRKTSKKFVFNL